MAEWKEVATVSEFESADRKLIDLGEDKLIGLFKVDGEYYAIDAYCSHQKTSIVHGGIEGNEIICPLHGARFDLRTGKHLTMPAVRPVKSFPVRVDGEKILIQV